MTAFAEDQIRRLVPRWRFNSDNPPSAEFSGDPRKPNLFTPDTRFLKEKIEDWENHRNIATAADAIACAITTGEAEQVQHIATFLLDHEAHTTKHVHQLANHALFMTVKSHTSDRLQYVQTSLDGTETKARAIVRTSRARLRQNPRNLLAYVDLSRAYTILGQNKHAVHAMENALRIAPSHRHSLRAAARLFVHTGDKERAHQLLTSNVRTRMDPWLMAAEISTAAISERSPRCIKIARNLIATGNHPIEHLSELYSALGTTDYWDGRGKRARQNLRNSLKSPTDNVVAQARWMTTQNLPLEISEEAWDLPLSFEARCWRALEMGKWEEAVGECSNWLRDEPFSSRPAMLGSCIGISVIQDYGFAETCARIGLRAEPNEQTLLNNLAVSLAYQNKLAEAKLKFNLIEKPLSGNYPEYIYMATNGLLHFRDRNIAEGRLLYEQAEQLAPKKNKPQVVIHQAREEQFAKTKQAPQILERAYECGGKSKDPYIRRLFSQLVHKPK